MVLSDSEREQARARADAFQREQDTNLRNQILSGGQVASNVGVTTGMLSRARQIREQLIQEGVTGLPQIPTRAIETQRQRIISPTTGQAQGTMAQPGKIQIFQGGRRIAVGTGETTGAIQRRTGEIPVTLRSAPPTTEIPQQEFTRTPTTIAKIESAARARRAGERIGFIPSAPMTSALRPTRAQEIGRTITLLAEKRLPSQDKKVITPGQDFFATLGEQTTTTRQRTAVEAARQKASPPIAASLLRLGEKIPIVGQRLGKAASFLEREQRTPEEPLSPIITVAIEQQLAGKITRPIAGKLRGAGITPRSVAEVITPRLKGALEQPLKILPVGRKFLEERKKAGKETITVVGVESFGEEAAFRIKERPLEEASLFALGEIFKGLGAGIRVGAKVFQKEKQAEIALKVLGITTTGAVAGTTVYQLSGAESPVERGKIGAGVALDVGPMLTGFPGAGRRAAREETILGRPKKISEFEFPEQRTRALSAIELAEKAQKLKPELRQETASTSLERVKGLSNADVDAIRATVIETGSTLKGSVALGIERGYQKRTPRSKTIGDVDIKTDLPIEEVASVLEKHRRRPVIIEETQIKDPLTGKVLLDVEVRQGRKPIEQVGIIERRPELIKETGIITEATPFGKEMFGRIKIEDIRTGFAKKTESITDPLKFKRRPKDIRDFVESGFLLGESAIRKAESSPILLKQLRERRAKKFISKVESFYGRPDVDIFFEERPPSIVDIKKRRIEIKLPEKRPSSFDIKERQISYLPSLIGVAPILVARRPSISGTRRVAETSFSQSAFARKPSSGFSLRDFPPPSTPSIFETYKTPPSQSYYGRPPPSQSYYGQPSPSQSYYGRPSPPRIPTRGFFLPGIMLGFGQGGGGGRAAPGGAARKEPTKFRPSLAGLALGITQEKIPKKLTGFEIRGIPTRQSKGKRRSPFPNIIKPSQPKKLKPGKSKFQIFKI